MLGVLRVPALIAAFGLAGLLKLGGNPWEKQLFRRWKLGDDVRHAVGAIETAGAVLLASRGTRRLGAAALAAVSVPSLAVEIDEGDHKLASVRALLLLMSLGVLLRGR